MKACTFVRAFSGSERTILGKVKKMPEVKSAFIVFGRYDIAVFYEAETFNDLRNVATAINSLEGVKSTETSIEG